MATQDDVWTLLKPAVAEARAAGHAWLESKQYVSRHALPELKSNTVGWPATVARDRLLSNDEDPPNWSLIFKLDGDSGSGISIAEMPAVRAFVGELARLAPQDSDVDRLINPRPGMHDSDTLRWRWLELGALLVMSQIIGRAEALSIGSEDGLHDLFCQLWIGHHAKALKADLIVPLLLTRFETDHRIALGDEVSIEPLSSQMQISRAVLNVGGRTENPYLIAAATHAVVISDVTVPVGPYPAVLDLDSVDLTKAQRVIECLEIIADGATGYAEVIARPRGWADRWTHNLLPLQGQIVSGEYPTRFARGAWNGGPSLEVNTDQEKSLVTAYSHLLKAKSNVRIAARRARRGGLRLDVEDELLDSAIGIEALLGNERDELTHRLALRASAVLAKDFEPAQMYRVIKEIYKVRSKVVHGASPKHFNLVMDGDTYSVVSTASYLLRLLMQDQLLNGPWSTDDIDAQILGSLRVRGSESGGEDS